MVARSRTLMRLALNAVLLVLARVQLVLAGVLLVLAGCVSPASHGPQLMGGAGPSYPPQAKADGIEGRVTVAYGITADGRVVNARVVAAEPPGVFDAAALAAVRSWRYRAARDAGRPVAVDQVTSNVDFRLDAPLEYELDD